jgi:hypothetical protein
MSMTVARTGVRDDALNESSPVFVVGCDRSGTTLLRLMLIHGPDLHIPQETNFLATLNARAADYGDFTEARQRWFFIRDLQANQATRATTTFPVFGLTETEAEEVLREAAPTTFAGASEALYRASARKVGKARWGDKTPRYVTAIPWLAEAFPTARFVHIIRDGRDVTLSLLANRWVLSVRDGAKFWKERVEMGRAAGRSLPESRYREIFYEQLVREPQQSLEELCQWLGMRFTTDMLRYYEDAEKLLPPQHAHLFRMNSRPVDASRARRWQQEMSLHDLADFDEVAGTLLMELGYERERFRMPAWRRSLRRLGSGAQRFKRRIGRGLDRVLGAPVSSASSA